jgi:hypothetical protein
MGFIAVLVLIALVGTIVYKMQPTSLNDASRYAQRLHALMYADATASAYLTHADENSPQESYEVARRMADDAKDAASTIDAPSEFSESGTAFEAYANQLSRSYAKIADLLNSPSLARGHDLLQSIAVVNAYAREAITAFKRDLAHSHFTKTEKQRILNRLL